MDRNQVKEVFKIIAFAYPKFEVSSEKIDFWLRFLGDQDYASVMSKVEYHIKNNVFPPTIADLREQETNGRYIPRDFNFDNSEGEDW